MADHVPLTEEEKNAIDRKVRAGVEAHGGITQLYQSSRASFAVAEAIKNKVEPSAKAKMQALAASVIALQGAYGKMIYESDWEAALALRPILGDIIERLGSTINEAKKVG